MILCSGITVRIWTVGSISLIKYQVSCLMVLKYLQKLMALSRLTYTKMIHYFNVKNIDGKTPLMFKEIIMSTSLLTFMTFLPHTLGF